VAAWAKHLLSLNVICAPLFMAMACLVENGLTVASGMWSAALRVTSVQPLAVWTRNITSPWPTAAAWCPLTKVTAEFGAMLL